MKRLAAFDVCGTITKTNNTFHFINFVLKKSNPLRYLLFKIIILLTFLLGAIRLNGLLKRDISRIWSIKLLRGYSKKDLEIFSEKYVQILKIKGLLNESIIQAIKKEKQKLYKLKWIRINRNGYV